MRKHHCDKRTQIAYKSQSACLHQYMGHYQKMLHKKSAVFVDKLPA